MHDLVVRNGTVVDGTGAPARVADVAVDGGRIAEVAPPGALGTADATRTIDAEGLLVTPGWVDVHTHYDGQATWDEVLAPSAWHGVTTLVMGNCGVGFAPARPDRRDWLIGLMEGVEDIPGTALSEGIHWEWETFPEYLDALERRRWTVDVGTQVAHGAVRAYVMGERGARNEPATPEDIAGMQAIVRRPSPPAPSGFSTSRTIAHRAIDGEPVPGTFAAEDELFGIGAALGELGTGVFELAPAGSAGEDIADPHKEIDWMRRLSAAIGRPVTFAMLQVDPAPELWRELLESSLEAVREGADLWPQVAGPAHRPALGPPHDLLALRRHPRLPGAEGQGAHPRRALQGTVRARPAPADRVVGAARRRVRGRAWTRPTTRPSCSASRPTTSRDPSGRWRRLPPRPAGHPWPWPTTSCSSTTGGGLLYMPILNYSSGDLHHARQMLLHPRAAVGLADGGAHVGIICDASMPTFMLTHWTRDRTRGERLPLEWVVKKQTRDTARLYGLGDRGTLEPGMLADLNVIDYERLQLGDPAVVADLPAGGKRHPAGGPGLRGDHQDGHRDLRRRPGDRGAARAARAGGPLRARLRTWPASAAGRPAPPR